MKLTVVWSPEAEDDLLAVPVWRDAEAVARAVDAFAEWGDETLRRSNRPGLASHFLVLTGYRVGLRIYTGARVVLVLSVVRASAP